MNDEPDLRKPEKKDPVDHKRGDATAIAMCIGISVGVALGAVTHNYGLWIPAGTAAGAAIGAFVDVFREPEEPDDPDDDEREEEP